MFNVCLQLLVFRMSVIHKCSCELSTRYCN